MAEAHQPARCQAGTRDGYGFYWTEGLRGLGWAQDAVEKVEPVEFGNDERHLVYRLDELRAAPPPADGQSSTRNVYAMPMKLHDSMPSVPSEDGSSCRLWATDNDGWLAAEGEVEFGSG